MDKNSKNNLIGVLDVGSSKIVCLIARPDAGGQLQIVGTGHQASFGIRAGSIANMDAAETAIGAAVQAAEQQAGETLRSVYVNLGGGQPNSSTIEVKVTTGGTPISQNALRRIAQQCKAALTEIDGAPLHIIPTSYSLDGSRGIKDPRGMVGSQLDVQLNAVTVNAATLRNLTSCVERCHLEVNRVILSPLASGRACLTPDEADLGSLIIDMGGGTTTLGVFSEGELVFTDAIPMGGIHVTNDIARGLTTPTAHAERMKILFGHAMTTTTDKHELIDIPQVGEDEVAVMAQVPRSLLTGIIQPRLEEIFEMVRARLEHAGFDKVSGRRVVLTGGASQMQGTRELAQLILDKQVRVGKPTPLPGMTGQPLDSLLNPAFSTAWGLLFYATQPNTEYRVVSAEGGAKGMLNRIGDWFRENVN
jgi:cell division protein FtsA